VVAVVVVVPILVVVVVQAVLVVVVLALHIVGRKVHLAQQTQVAVVVVCKRAATHITVVLAS
jgi:hypothetical protein